MYFTTHEAPAIDAHSLAVPCCRLHALLVDLAHTHHKLQRLNRIAVYKVSADGATLKLENYTKRLSKPPPVDELETLFVLGLLKCDEAPVAPIKLPKSGSSNCTQI
jgi:hypothetical protein